MDATDHTAHDSSPASNGPDGDADDAEDAAGASDAEQGSESNENDKVKEAKDANDTLLRSLGERALPIIRGRLEALRLELARVRTLETQEGSNQLGTVLQRAGKSVAASVDSVVSPLAFTVQASLAAADVVAQHQFEVAEEEREQQGHSPRGATGVKFKVFGEVKNTGSWMSY